jgi:hypothetical protein
MLISSKYVDDLVAFTGTVEEVDDVVAFGWLAESFGEDLAAAGEVVVVWLEQFGKDCVVGEERFG